MERETENRKADAQCLNRSLLLRAPRFRIQDSRSMFHVSRFTFREKGFTIIEMLIYVGIAGVVMAVITSSLMDNLKAYDKSVAQQNVFQNTNGALRTIIDEIRYAKSVYMPTSVLDADAGQLSVETALNAPSGENGAYVDFYVDNGRVYEKRDGQSTNPLTSERVFVEQLRFTKFSSATGKDSVTVSIQARINTQSTNLKDQARIAVNSSATLRGAY
ncbi:type II secretion system protein [Candidatus Azambacteria bacterium]|nr:type II secretion system protein [Candidatus Azambacteria bacterium]